MQQIHPIPPLFCSTSKVLILGSFPSVKSREQAFFYGHSQNRFWKVTAAVFNCPVPQYRKRNPFSFPMGLPCGM